MTVISPPAQALPQRNVLAAFAIFILLVGGGSVAIRITYLELAPFWVAASRFAIAAIVFWFLAFIQNIPLPKGRALLGAVLFGGFTIGLAFALMAWGLVAIPASLFQILMALVPLFTLFLSSIQGLEAITLRGLIGSLLAVLGIVLTVGGMSGGAISLPHVAAIILAAIITAQGGVLIKRFPPIPPIMTNAIGMSIGALVLGAISLVNGEAWTLPSQASTWLAFIYLVIFVTILSFLLYVFILSNWTASGSSYGFVMIPLITLVVAASLADEQINLSFLTGAGFVLAGVLIGALLPSRKKSAAIEECKSCSGQVLPHCT